MKGIHKISELSNNVVNLNSSFWKIENYWVEAKTQEEAKQIFEHWKKVKGV